MEEPYRNREIDEMLRDIKAGQERLEKKQDDTIEQTTKTNGRVTRLERIVTILVTAVIVLTVSRTELLPIFLKLIGI